MQKVYLGITGAQAFYWGQVAARERLGLSDKEAIMGIRDISIFRGNVESLHIDYDSTYCVIVSFTSQLAHHSESYCQLVGIDILLYNSHAKRTKLNIHTLPGYTEWLTEMENRAKAAA